MLKKLDTDKCCDISELGRLFYKEITGTKCDYYNYDDKYKYDSEILDSNKDYLHEVYLFKNEDIKRQFYMAVSRNCSLYVDSVIYSWFEGEQDEYLKRKILCGFAENIFKFKSGGMYSDIYSHIDDEKADKKLMKWEIRNNEIRFKRLADIAINDNSSSIRGYVFRIAPYFRAETGWHLIKQIFDFYKQSYSISYYLTEIDQLEPDKLQLIEVGKLTRYLYIYLINGLAFEKNSIPAFFVKALDILSR